MTYYTAFPASSALQNLNETFVTGIAQPSAPRMTPALIELLELFTDECMNAYFLGPMSMIDLNPMGKKVVQGGVSAIKKTIKVALKKVLGKMSNDEIRPLADYIETLLLRPAPDSDLPTYIGVELPDELHARLMGSIHAGREGSPKAVAKEFSIGMCELVDVSIDCYFEKPMQLMKLGYLSEKIARLANESVRTGAQSVIKKVTKTMNDEELLAFFDFAESIMVDGPAQ